MGAPRLGVSVVAFGPDVSKLGSTLVSLAAAVARLSEEGDGARLFLVDNGPRSIDRSARLLALVRDWHTASELIDAGGNVGFGRGHNLAIARCDGTYHLILNPDVDLAPEALVKAVAFMDSHADCGLLTPAVRGGEGELQYLCKRVPTVLDLLLRGFAPRWVRARFRARLDHYEMRDLINARDVVWDPPIVSGCFMLFRTEVLKALGGFDPRYFLYFEDFDLSLRTARLARIAYVPSVRIVHHGGDAARKGLSHVRMFIRSAITFFQRSGWRWL